MNKVVLMGRLTKDPDVRSANGKTVTTFTLAVDRPFSKTKEADFIPIVLWERTAEIVGTSCKKGHRLLVEGRLQVRSFDSNGAKKWVTEVIGNNVEFIEKKEEITL